MLRTSPMLEIYVAVLLLSLFAVGIFVARLIPVRWRQGDYLMCFSMAMVAFMFCNPLVLTVWWLLNGEIIFP